MNVNPIVLYSNLNDPFVELLRGQVGITIIHLDDLTDHISSAVWPRVLDVSFPEALKVAFRGAYVFNRVLSFADTTLGAKLKSWGYQDTWGHYAVRPLLSSARQLAHDPGPRGISRTFMPLNTQWWMMGEQDHFRVPKFEYSFGAVIPDMTGFKDPIRKSIWSLHDWREENHFGPGEDSWHAFHVGRSSGTPVICNFVHDRIGFIFPKKNVKVNRAEFEFLVERVRQVFHSQIGEILTYVDEDGCATFYAFSATLATSVANDDFIGRLEKLLVAEGARARLTVDSGNKLVPA